MYNSQYIFHNNKNINSIIKNVASLHTEDIDLSLKRIKLLLKKIGNPHQKLNNIIHIAGTNGKGSTATIIFQLQMRAGRTVNVYRSPHILSLNERIFIQNKQIPDNYFLKILKYVYKKNNDFPITLFEFLTAVTFFAFFKNPSDINILEVGLGGRLDATNVIEKKKISIITPIGIDHKKFLGDNVESIAKEKAGIICKNDIIICSKQNKSVMNVLIKEIKKNQGQAFIYGKDWKIKNKILYYKNNKVNLSNLSLEGKHQFFNAACAILACKKSAKIVIKDKDIIDGLSKISWAGRLQKIDLKFNSKLKNINIWIDAAHNELGFKVIKDWIRENNLKDMVIILGIGKNKDLKEIMPKLKEIKPSIVCIVKKLKIPSHSYKEINKLANGLSIKTIISNDLKNSLKLCRNFLREKSLNNILITGSISLIGEAIALSKL